MDAIPRISYAELAAGHDGRAEIVLRVRYPNGAESRLRLDAEEAFRVLDDSGIASLSELAGQPWNVLAAAATPPPSRTKENA